MLLLGGAVQFLGRGGHLLLLCGGAARTSSARLGLLHDALGAGTGGLQRL